MKTPLQQRVDQITRDAADAAKRASEAASLVRQILSDPQSLRNPGRSCFVCGAIIVCPYREPELLRIHGLI